MERLKEGQSDYHSLFEHTWPIQAAVYIPCQPNDMCLYICICVFCLCVFACICAYRCFNVFDYIHAAVRLSLGLRRSAQLASSGTKRHEPGL